MGTRHTPVQYPPRTVADWRADGLRRVYVHCVGQHQPSRDRCWHQACLPLEGLPPTAWSEVCPRFRCTECGSLGYVSLQPAWGDVINYSQGIR
jgi:hypothetical protein